METYRDCPHCGDSKCCEDNEARIAELEKENAALKARLETLRKYAEGDYLSGSYIPLDEYEPAAALYGNAPFNA